MTKRILEELRYFVEAHFFQSISWDELEEAIIDHRKVSREERYMFKEELLYLQSLLNNNQLNQLEDIIKENGLDYSKLWNAEKIHKFLSEALPIIEKYEFKEDIPYVPLDALNYMLETMILPTNTIFSFEFIAIEIQREGDTYIDHILRDLKLIEEAFKENKLAKIQEFQQMFHKKGIYILDSPYKDSIIKELINEIS